MRDLPNPESLDESEEFDYSTPEAQRALQFALALVAEIREEGTGKITRRLARSEKKLKAARRQLARSEKKLEAAKRRLALYEKSLGAAVVPVLARRVFIKGARRLSERRQDPR